MRLASSRRLTLGIGVSVKAHGAERARRAAERGLDAGHVRARDEAWLGGDGAAGVVGVQTCPVFGM